MNYSVFRKTMKYSRKPKDIKLAITDARGNYLASEPNYHTTIFFSKNLSTIEMKKRKVYE